MPRSKRAVRNVTEALVAEAKMLDREELETLDKPALLIQKILRLRLLDQMVGTLYPPMVQAEITRIDELLEV